MRPLRQCCSTKPIGDVQWERQISLARVTCQTPAASNAAAEMSKQGPISMEPTKPRPIRPSKATKTKDATPMQTGSERRRNSVEGVARSLASIGDSGRSGGNMNLSRPARESPGKYDYIRRSESSAEDGGARFGYEMEHGDGVHSELQLRLRLSL